MAGRNSFFVKLIAHGVHILLGVCTTLIFLSAGFIMLVTIIPIRKLVSYWLQFVNKNVKVQLMEPMDALIRTDGRSSSQLLTVYFLAPLRFGKENLEQLRSKLTYNIIHGNYGKLQFVPCTKYGFRCWKSLGTGGFDIQNHVKLYPGEGDSMINRAYSEAEFTSILDAAVNNSISCGDHLPNWEVLVVPRVVPKSKRSTIPVPHVGVIIRMSHGYMDGVSIYKFIQTSIFDKEEETQISHARARKWNFSRKAVFYLKMFVFGILNSVTANLIHGKPAYKHGASYTGKGFLGSIHVTGKSVRKILTATNCQSSAALFTTAFLSALRSCGETMGMEICEKERMPVALTTAVPETFHNEKPQNRFAFYFRRLPAPLTESLAENLRYILKTSSELIHISQDNEYETIANFYAATLAGLLPDKGIRIVMGFCRGFLCTVSLTPFSKQIFKCQGAPVTSLVGAPPHGCTTPYILSVTHYGGDFFAAVSVAEASLIHSRNEFQELLSRFKDCFNLFEEIVVDSL